MGQRKINVKQSAADNIAAIVWYIESKGLITTAERFTDRIYDFFIKLADNHTSHAIWRCSSVFPIKRNIQLYLLNRTLK